MTHDDVPLGSWFSACLPFTKAPVLYGGLLHTPHTMPSMVNRERAAVINALLCGQASTRWSRLHGVVDARACPAARARHVLVRPVQLPESTRTHNRNEREVKPMQCSSCEANGPSTWTCSKRSAETTRRSPSRCEIRPYLCSAASSDSSVNLV
jgi:hypothetical protein